MPPLSLSMLKMEKNFVAHLEKKYPRKPYEVYPVSNRDVKWKSLIGFVKREMDELDIAIKILEGHTRTRAKGHDVPDNRMIRDQVMAAMWEVGDVSNTLDYLFEGLIKLHSEFKEK